MSKTAKKPNTVTLDAPLKIDGKDVNEIGLRTPTAGELRGLKLSEVLVMDVNAHMELLPRITQPPVSGAQLAAMAPHDFTKLVTGALLFFVSSEQLDQIKV